MNIPKEAIEKAIEGGWVSEWSASYEKFWAIIALDATFWRSLENATGKTARAMYLDFCAANWDAETDKFWLERALSDNK